MRSRNGPSGSMGKVALAEGVLALALLILLQYAITWLSVRSPRFQAIIKAQPTLLVYRGDFVASAMVRQRVTREEVMAVLRAQGNKQLDGVLAVVLETDGSFSVVPGPSSDPAPPTLEAVARL
ncbi:YetF domain-containing protein [Azospirillum sp. TSO35-2]|uniref:DUF421 domain-containing protein n=1 Tax=Azospirillum sp. TSO35-2 TaxID=716796 RepID=UPI001FFE4803|nr:YetF domain-containing protein [Azospirillum sp. TSO35-2]